MKTSPKRIAVRQCIKRLHEITIKELHVLSTRDLNGIIGLQAIMGPVNMELEERNQMKEYNKTTFELTNGVSHDR